MGDGDDGVLAPMVDALTGAMSAILLISLFLLINTPDMEESAKEYGQQSLLKAQDTIEEISYLNLPATVIPEQNKLSYYKVFKLTEEQLNSLSSLFENRTPKKITIYSDSNDEMVSYNLISFLSGVDLVKHLNDIDIEMLPARTKNISEIVWAF